MNLKSARFSKVHKGYHEIRTHIFSSATVASRFQGVSSTGFIIFKFWRQTNDVMTASLVSIQSLDLCGHKMRTSLGLEPRPPITASRQPLKPGCALPLCYDAPGREQVGTHIYISTPQFFSVFIYNLLANHVSHSLFVWYKPIYTWTWNLPDYLKSQRLSRD